MKNETNGPDDRGLAGEWRYAILVLLLLVLGGASSFIMVEVFAGHPLLADAGPVVRQMTLAFVALTTGFLFLGGAFGIWAMRTTTAMEGMRRIGAFIDDLDFLRDGMVVVDTRRRIVGMNEAARALASGNANREETLRGYFPDLTAEDEDLLLHPSHPPELERVARRGHSLYSLRFRSQPAPDMHLVMVSDITASKTRQMRDLQVAHFHLMGRIARGVAHDFNNVLCSIAAHAGLLERDRSGAMDGGDGRDSQGEKSPVEVILEQAERGSSLARQLIQFSELDAAGRPTDRLPTHVANAAELLEVVVSPLWTIETHVQGIFPAVPIDGNHVEQILLNLGLHAVEDVETPGTLRIELRPSEWQREGAREATIDIVANPPGAEGEGLDGAKEVETEDAGVMESVIRSVVERAGGELDIFAYHDGHHAYRLRLPGLMAARDRVTAMTDVPEESGRRVQHWRVMLARPRDRERSDLEQRFKALGMQVEFVTDLVLVLGRMETEFPFEVVVIDRRLLGEAAEALLRAMLKLKPAVGLVVLCAAPDAEPEELKREVAFETLDASAVAVVEALVRARDLAQRRCNV